MIEEHPIPVETLSFLLQSGVFDPDVPEHCLGFALGMPIGEIERALDQSGFDTPFTTALYAFKNQMEKS